MSAGGKCKADEVEHLCIVRCACGCCCCCCCCCVCRCLSHTNIHVQYLACIRFGRQWMKQPRVVDGFILKTAVKEHRSLPNSCFHVSWLTQHHYPLTVILACTIIPICVLVVWPCHLLASEAFVCSFGRVPCVTTAIISWQKLSSLCFPYNRSDDQTAPCVVAEKIFTI